MGPRSRGSEMIWASNSSINLARIKLRELLADAEGTMAAWPTLPVVRSTLFWRLRKRILRGRQARHLRLLPHSPLRRTDPRLAQTLFGWARHSTVEGQSARERYAAGSLPRTLNFGLRKPRARPPQTLNQGAAGFAGRVGVEAS